MENDFKPPTPLFEKNNPADNWGLWKQKFKIYLTASGKQSATEEVKIANLLSCIGDEGIDIYNTFTEDEKSTIEKLTKAFDDHFLPKKVVLMESFKFHTLIQGDYQNIDQYLTELKKQAKLCEFACSKDTCKEPFEERMVRDRLIIGINCKESQLRLLREPDLTIKKIVDYCKSVELSKQHVKVVNHEEEVNFVKNSRKYKCRRCLYEHHPDKCPAKNKECNICRRIGHFSNYFKDTGEVQKPKIETVRGENSRQEQREAGYQNKGNNIRCIGQREDNIEEEEETSEEEGTSLFVNECNGGNISSWHENILVEGVKVTFKLDSGSDISIIPKKMYSNIRDIPNLKKSNVTLISYGNFKFKPVGEVILKCNFKNLSVPVKFVVVDFNSEPLLGLDDCLKLSLIKRVNCL